MKKLLGILLVFAVLFGVMGMAGMANVAVAQAPPADDGEDGDGGGGAPSDFKDPTETAPTGLLESVGDLEDLIDTITNWFFFILITVAVIFIILAAMQFITAGGDSAKVSEARTKLIWAAVGIGIAILARSIPVLVKSLLGAAAS